jgi:hypothetical protein
MQLPQRPNRRGARRIPRRVSEFIILAEAYEVAESGEIDSARTHELVARALRDHGRLGAASALVDRLPWFAPRRGELLPSLITLSSDERHHRSITSSWALSYSVDVKPKT